MPDTNARVVRRLARALALTPVLLVPLAAAPALAAPPEGWPETESPSVLGYLMLLVIIPLAAALVITLLTIAPSLARGERYTPGRSWRGESEWFGGPKTGLDAVDREPVQVTAGSETNVDTRGGASARW